MLADVLTSIPVISPIEIIFPREAGARLLPAGATVDEDEPEYPDYTVQELAPQELSPSTVAPQALTPAPDPAMIALDEMEHATAVSEYHDFEWWRTRIAAIRSALAQSGETSRP